MQESKPIEASQMLSDLVKMAENLRSISGSINAYTKDECLYQSARRLSEMRSVCAEVLRQSTQRGMSSAVSLPNHTFTGQA